MGYGIFSPADSGNSSGGLGIFSPASGTGNKSNSSGGLGIFSPAGGGKAAGRSKRTQSSSRSRLGRRSTGRRGR